MQQMRADQDMLMTKRLDAIEQERDRALDELHEMKKLAQEANMRLSETMSHRKVADIYTEMNSAKEALSEELKVKERIIEKLKIESGKVKKELETIIAEKDASLDELKGVLNSAKSAEAHAMSLCSESKNRIQELEDEIEKRKESEKRIFDSFVAQTEQLEQAMILHEESKLEINSLRERLKKLEGSSGQNLRYFNASQTWVDDSRETIESLKFELQLAEENLARSQEKENKSSFGVKCLLEEVSILKSELKLVSEAEENNKKAMDDLALVLKEVASEASNVKEKLASTEEERKLIKSEAEELKLKLKSTEDIYKMHFDELKKEVDLYKNTAERLRLEAEESLLAWSEKESGFVACIKRAEEERDAAQLDNSNALELLERAENASRSAKEENLKLRDILKQALNEANVAKEASEIARAENSQLQDALHAKEEALNFISRENENLKMNEAAAIDSIKELKRLLSETPAKWSEYSVKGLKPEDTEQGKKSKPTNSIDMDHKDGKKLKDGLKLNIKDLKDSNNPKDIEEKAPKYTDKDTKLPSKHKDKDEDSVKPYPLQGSIFEVNSPCSAAHHRRKSSISFTEDGKTLIAEEVENSEVTHFEESDGDRSTRKKKALMRRFGDILMRRSTHKNEPSLE